MAESRPWRSSARGGARRYAEASEEAVRAAIGKLSDAMGGTG
jgi:hypothetical protein